jgi:hypothetical protein
MRRASAVEILSSSPFDLGSIANEIAGSGNAIGGYWIGCAGSASVSEVRVSLSLATTPRRQLGHRDGCLP